MVTYISARLIYPVDSAPIKNGVIGVASDGTIEAVLTEEEAKEIKAIQYYDGVIVPGLINTHCHLELSHLKGKIKEKTGLTGFIKEILAQREQAEEAVLSAMQNADAEMRENGIVAVGDISNLLISKSVKLGSEIYYQTFIEVYGFNRPSAPIIEGALQMKANFKPLKATIVPHAPYSVSTELFRGIAEISTADDVLSIHNQETAGENELFETGTGSFATFFAAVGIAQNEGHNQGQNALHYHLPQLPKTNPTLLVHNTLSTKQDLDFAKATHQNLYWCLCPNANLYIEGVLPDVALFQSENLKLTLGTDSLASNHQLSILAEMQALQEFKSIAFEELLTWATLNGAAFLGIDSQYGSLTPNKKPGVVLIGLAEDGLLTRETTIKRLF